MFKVNNFTPFLSFTIVDFEQVVVSWVVTQLICASEQDELVNFLNCHRTREAAVRKCSTKRVFLKISRNN